MLKQNIALEELDIEWIKLIQCARRMGLSIEEVRDFFYSHEEQISK